MSISWSDFFRPDAQSSNRSLKKFLEDEGLKLGHRDLVLLRQLAQKEVYLSYAALECWAEGEVQRELFEEVAESLENSSRLTEILEEAELCWVRAEEGTTLVGVAGECGERSGETVVSSQALVRSSQSVSSPMLAVYGNSGLASQPAAGGAWSEEKLQTDSMVLLDGESSQELVEAFRHLFRAAPNGTARASVVVAALSRHRAELDMEVSEKLEEIAPAFGQAMRRLFETDLGSGCRALQFLLNSEQGNSRPEWSIFWQQIRPTILESLARTEHGTNILLRSIDSLAGVISGDKFLNHQLLDAFLERLDELTPLQQDKLIQMIGDWARTDEENVRLLRSRLELTGVQNQRLLLGESLRRTFEQIEDHEGLAELAEIFVAEAVSAGSTAGSLALAELLRSFGSLVLASSSRYCQNLAALTERQVLNLLEVWELMVAHDKSLLPDVGELFLRLLSEPADHLSLILKSDLLRRPQLEVAFQKWLADSDFTVRKQVMSVGFKWSLTVENRPLLARCLRRTEWGFQDFWEGEWRRPHLSYQRLGWLAYCASPREVEFSSEVTEQLAELLKAPPGQQYFWELQRWCATFEQFPEQLREAQLASCFEALSKLDTSMDEEIEALFLVGAESLRRHPKNEARLQAYSLDLKEGPQVKVWWLSGLLEKLYAQDQEAPVPPRELVSALILRLLSSGEHSMSDMLSRALAATDEEAQTSDDFLPLQVTNRAYRALAAIGSHQACPESLKPTIRRRLALFLVAWAKQLRRTDDPYSYRETPLFAIVTDFLDDSALQELLKEIAETFFELHRKFPDKFRLEVRHTAQQLFRSWAERHPGDPIAAGWLRVL